MKKWRENRIEEERERARESSFQHIKSQSEIRPAM